MSELVTIKQISIFISIFICDSQITCCFAENFKYLINSI